MTLWKETKTLFIASRVLTDGRSVCFDFRQVGRQVGAKLRDTKLAIQNSTLCFLPYSTFSTKRLAQDKAMAIELLASGVRSILHILLYLFFFLMGQSRPFFVYFHSFPVTISTQIEKSIDGVLGIRTRGRRMVGADETTELWRPPLMKES